MVYNRRAEAKAKTASRMSLLSLTADVGRVLIKNSRSGMSINEDKINRILSSTKNNAALFKSFRAKTGGLKAPKKAGGAQDSGARHREGDQVGEGAERIGGDNIGHRLLSNMG